MRRTQSFDRLKGEAEKCLAQSEKFNSEKMEFESAIYAKVCAFKFPALLSLLYYFFLFFCSSYCYLILLMEFGAKVW